MSSTDANTTVQNRGDSGEPPDGDRATAGPADPAEQEGLGTAGAQLSTAPVEETGRTVPGSFGGRRRPGLSGGLGWLAREVIGWLRWFWRQLTSMRVALLLLLLLSLGSIPGSLIPQNGADPVKVEAFRQRHETLGPLYDKLGMFHVYSSVWFSAIYILLFVSLIGCILPRSWQFIGQLRDRPPGAPRRLNRLPAYTTWHTDASPDQVLDAALRTVKGKRFRAHPVGDAVAAEKGYLREAGNLLFHIALVVMLISFAVGSLWKSEGGKLITAGKDDGFSNTLTQYDDFSSGPLFDTGDLEPFGFSLDGFDASYQRSGPEKGTARHFRAHVSYWKGADGEDRKASIGVNDPLEVGDSKVYLVGNGYAPVVTVRDGRGKVVYDGAVPFLPQDENLTSSGVVKVPDYRDYQGHKDQLGFSGWFVPTFGGQGSGTMFSQFPAPDYPVLLLTAYHGDLGVDAGTPKNVYQLDTDKLTQFKDAKGNSLAKSLTPGETMKLPNGAGSITFERVQRWATFQISHQPGTQGALIGAVAALLGLVGSLFIQRRRVWVRAVPGESGGTVVEMAGLGRSESHRLPEELADLAGTLQSSAPPVAEPRQEDGAGTGPEDGGPAAGDGDGGGDDGPSGPGGGEGNDGTPGGRSGAPGADATPTDDRPDVASAADAEATDARADAAGETDPPSGGARHRDAGAPPPADDRAGATDSEAPAGARSDHDVPDDFVDPAEGARA